jgi:hypothetical protein
MEDARIMSNRISTLVGGVKGLFVSKPGFDVLTTDKANLQFEINSTVSRIIGQGTLNLPAGTDSVSVPLSGTNGRTPFVSIFVTWKVATGTQANVWQWGVNYTVTSTLLTVTADNNNSDQVITYILFTDTVN